MKRNFLSTGLLTVFSAAALTLAITAAPAEDGWHKIGRNKTSAQATINPKASSQSPGLSYRRSRGLIRQDAQLRPQGDCIQRGGALKRPGLSRSHRSIEEPRGNVYAIVNRHNEMTYKSQAYIAKVDLKTGALDRMYQSAELCAYIGEDYDLQSNVYRKGLIYCPTSNQEIAEGATFGWEVIDFETGDYVGYVSFGGDILGAPYSLTYDEDKDLFYGLSIGSNSGSQLCIFDPKKFNLNGGDSSEALEYREKIAPGAHWFGAISYNPLDKKLYVFDEENNVYTVDPMVDDPFKKTEVVEAGYLDTYYDIVTDGFATGLTYSPMDEMFVTLYRDNDIKGTRLLFIDPNDWSVVEGGVVTDPNRPFIADFITSDEFADADAPELAAKPVVNFDKASLTGTITFTTPEYTYYGVAIGSTPLKVSLMDGDNVLFEGTMAANETKTITATLTQGTHNLTLATYIGELRSPVRSYTFYVGYDNPCPVTDLMLDIDKLTWTAPGAVGAHGGFVDTNMLEYDVYVDDKQQNANPIETESFKLRLPADMKRADIKVVARANNMESEAASISDVIGDALTLPQSFAPSDEDAKLFTVVNNNYDERRWYKSRITEGDDPWPVWAFEIGYFNDADDWLILPAIDFPDAEKMYNLSFKLGSFRDIDGHGTDESFEVLIANKPTVEALKNGICAVKYDHYSTMQTWDQLSVNFAVPTAGRYYIALHCFSSKANESWGMITRDFTVDSVEGQNSGVPGDPEIKVTAGAEGDQSANFEIKLPTKDVIGRDLDPTSKVNINITHKGFGDIFEAKGEGLPGETIKMTCYVDNDGFADFSITPSNENGTGYTRVVRQYCGIDTPLAPTNIQGVPSEDNRKMNLTWDAPGTVGYNGGYVDPYSLKYVIYTRSGVSYYEVGEVAETHCEYNPNNEKLIDYYVGPAARNEAGESKESRFVQDQLGKPYDTPAKEYWNTTSFSLSPYTFKTTGEYDGSEWQSIGNAEGLGKLFTGATLQQGGLISYSSTGGPVMSQLITPKVSTTGMEKAIYTLRFWDNIDTPQIRIFGRRHGHNEAELIHTFIPENSSKPHWNEASFNLPAEYLNCSWVQFRIDVSLTGGETEYLLLDTWSVFPDYEYDLGITAFSGPSQISVGDVATYDVKVVNGGSERNDGTLTVDLLDKGGNVKASFQTQISKLDATKEFEAHPQFEITGDFTDLKSLTARAKVTATEDEGANNNERSIEVALHNAQIPAVGDLKGELNSEKGVNLEWTAPVASYGDFDNFEYHPAFNNSDKIGEWKNIDQDGFVPEQVANGALSYTWEGSDQPCAWIVIDAEKLNLQGDERAAALSGKQYLIARAAALTEQDNPNQYQSSKWLISPRIQGGSKLSFWVNTLSADKEYFEIWYTTADDPQLGTIDPRRPNNCGDFQGRKALYKGGSELWEQITYDVPARATHIAIRYCSFDGMLLMLDDLNITPEDMLTRNADHFALYRSEDNGDFYLVADNINGETYTDADFKDAKSTRYYVQAYSEVDGSMIGGPKSNIIEIQGSSVDTLTTDNRIAGGHGVIILTGFEGQQIQIVAADGKVVLNTAVRAPQASYGMQPGIYMVKTADKTVKVIVK